MQIEKMLHRVSSMYSFLAKTIFRSNFVFHFAQREKMSKSQIFILSFAIATLVASATIAVRSNPANIHPLELYVREASGNRNGPLTDRDIVKAYAVEVEERSMSVMQSRMAPHIMKWFQAQLGAYPVLTTQPEQLHLSVTEVEGNVTILWTTSNTSQSSMVCYYLQGSDIAETCRNGTVWTYHPISVVPWYGSLHGAHMIGLVPRQTYCYRVGDPTLGVWSNQTCFEAPQLEKDTLTVAFGGDMGSVQLFGYLVADQMRSDEISNSIKYDAFWLLGDIAYSTLDPGPRSPNGEFFWDLYMRQEQSLVDHVPFLVTYGNHDFNAGDSGAFINRFRNPQGGRGFDNFYWSYTHGPVKFVSMCTEVALVPDICDYAPGSKQYMWLEDQFASINRTETPWLILGGHRPMYSSDEATDSGPLQLYIEPLLRKYNVDLEISGHMHDTELITPVFNNTPYLEGVSKTSATQWTFLNPQAPVHVTVGAMGALQDEKYPTNEPQWSLFHSGRVLDDAYGFARMTVNRTTLHIKFLQQKSDDLMWEVFIQKTI